MTRENRSFLGSLLALLSLAGCRHEARLALVTSAPVLMVGVPPPTHRTEPLPMLEVETSPSLNLQLSRQLLPRFRPRPTTTRQLALLLPVPPPPVVLGELSTGSESNDLNFQQQTETLLRSQQQRLQNLPDAASLSHQQQVGQARLFLKEALEAWRSRDVAGAHVLALKTKLLLDEL